MSEFIDIPREPNPSCKLPVDLDTPVWRYMDVDKFCSLLEEKALYLCRADRLQDRFEGTYSRQQILEMEDWLAKIKEPKVIESEREDRRKDRLRTYINCWCMSDCDLDLMWKGYVRNPPGVAVKSSVKKLINICDQSDYYWPLDISIVTYFDNAGGESISYPGTPTAFFYKDNHFRLDNELRIVHYPNISEPTPTHVFLKIEDLSDLIVEVVLQPTAKDTYPKFLREALNNMGLEKIPIIASRYDRELIE